MIRVLTVAAATALALAGCAPMPSGSPGDGAARPCFLPQTTTNFTVDRDTTAYIRAGRNEVFELQSGGCHGLGAARSIGLSPISSPGSRLCVGDTVGLTIAGPSPASENNSQCRARIMRRLSEAEVAALPGRLRP